MSRIKKHKLKSSTEVSAKKKETSKALIYSIILGALMVFGVFGVAFYGFSGGGEERAYGDHKFVLTQDGWQVKINKQKIVFDYHPEDILYLNISPEVGVFLRSAPGIVTTVDPNSSIIEYFEYARFSIASIATPHLGKQIGNAVTKESDQYNQPVITCANATNQMPVIIFEEAEEPSI